MQENREGNNVANPFATPTVTSLGAIPNENPESDIREFHLGKSITCWSLVCLVSAAPSFLFGMMLGPQVVIHGMAMIAGVLSFAAVYVLVESLDWTRRKLMDKSLRIAVRTGYITRIAISIIFPVAIFTDIWCGLFSVSLTSALFGGGMGPEGFLEGEDTQSSAFVFVWFYVTTLVQGIALNIVLGGYTLVVYGLVLVFRRDREP